MPCMEALKFFLFLSLSLLYTVFRILIVRGPRRTHKGRETNAESEDDSAWLYIYSRARSAVAGIP